MARLPRSHGRRPPRPSRRRRRPARSGRSCSTSSRSRPLTKPASRPSSTVSAPGGSRPPAARKDGELHWPPRTACPKCHAEELDWVDLPEQGTVYAFSAVLGGAPLGMEDEVPFAVGLVDLDGSPLRLFGRIEGRPWTDLRIGQRVRVEPYERGRRTVLLPLPGRRVGTRPADPGRPFSGRGLFPRAAYLYRPQVSRPPVRGEPGLDAVDFRVVAPERLDARHTPRGVRCGDRGPHDLDLPDRLPMGGALHLRRRLGLVLPLARDAVHHPHAHEPGPRPDAQVPLRERQPAGAAVRLDERGARVRLCALLRRERRQRGRLVPGLPGPAVGGAERLPGLPDRERGQLPPDGPHRCDDLPVHPGQHRFLDLRLRELPLVLHLRDPRRRLFVRSVR